MKTKQMKVYESWNSSHKRNPKICMEGKWLESLGFHIGDQIQISYEDNRIQITAIPSMVCEAPADYSTNQKMK